MIKKLVIPVAGLGTRFLPVTKSVPKEMLPIVDIPTIQLLIQEAYESGIEEILLINSRKKECIINHFKNDEYLFDQISDDEKKVNILKNISKNISIKEIIQEKPKGTGDAIKLAESFVNGEPFAVMFGDNLIKGQPALKELISMYDKYHTNIIGLKYVKNYFDYGIVEVNNDIITNIVEKPSYPIGDNLAAIGRYIFNNEIFTELKKLNIESNKECQLTDAILNLMKKQNFYSCVVSGEYFDIGSQLGFIKANIAYALDRDEIKKDLLKYMKEI